MIDVRREGVEEVVEQTARCVFGGGTVVYPDETGYVIACDPQHGAAVARIYETAGANANLRVALCVASPAEFLEFAPENPLAILAVKRLLPAPVALILRRPVFFAEEQTAGRLTVGFRVPEDPLAHAILERCGPLLAASTAYAGEGQPPTPADLLLERGEVAPRLETSVVDLTGSRARLLREGAVPFDRLVARFGPIERPAMRTSI
ncbi:MAG TPA: Sua5/YciO/YrdC/YwlC family protein [Candidatus Tyrphobacter sp.]